MSAVTYVENWTGGKAVGFVRKELFYKDETANLLEPTKDVLFFMDWAEGIDPEFFAKRERYQNIPDTGEKWFSQDYDTRLRATHLLFPRRIGQLSPLYWKELP
jgi:hypothetical protein